MTVVFAIVLIVFGFALGRRSGRHSSRTPVTDPYLAAARAYCLARFDYTGPYHPGGREAHIENDARDTADVAWLRAAVDATLGREGGENR